MATNPDNRGGGHRHVPVPAPQPFQVKVTRLAYGIPVAATWSTPTTPPSCGPWRAGGDVMRRVLVLGCPGAGKSTLARSLGEALSLPVVHLDKLWWKVRVGQPHRGGV